jgi:hypothetical protein
MITDLDVQHELLKVALLSTDNYLSIEEAAQDAGRANSVMMKDFLYHYDSAYRALVSIGILDQHQEYMQKHLNNMWKMSHDDDATLADNPYAETTGMSGEMGESRVNSFLGFHAEKEKELNESEVTEDLRKWFKEKWVRMDTKGNIKGDCAREAGEGKPKCLPQAKANALSQEERARAARRKRREDPNPEREGKAIFVKTESVTESVETLEEKNVPTSPEKWAQAKAAAKSKFAVYPCVPLDSLAISKNGPALHDELDIGDEILTYNMEKDVLEWKPIIHKHYYENAPLLEIGKPTGFSIRCTPNHKWVIIKENKPEYDPKTITHALVETKDLNTHMKILMCATLKNDSTLLIENWSKKDNWIEKVLSMNEKEREIFLASSVVYDGWDKGVSTKIKDRHTFGFVQKEYDHLWASLLAAYLNGYYVNSKQKAEDMTTASYIRNKRFHNTQNLYKKESGNEDVWCPTTENETWVMIQNGLITITGNSAYANGWAAKKYKEMGGGWKSVSEESDSFKSFCDFHDSGIVEEEFTSDGNELYEDWGEVAEQVDGKTLNKPFLTPNGPKKRAVYVKNDSGNVVKVNFGDPHMEIKRDNPERRKSYRARHNCDNPGPKHKANYWSCKFWSTTPVSKL